jgi:hypothetical protein
MYHNCYFYYWIFCGLLHDLHVINELFPVVISSALDGWNGAFLVTAIGTGLRILTHIAKKDFRIYLARGYCIITAKKEGELQNVGYLSLVIDSYDKFLR